MSMDKNLAIEGHEVIIFIDSDNQGTFEWLKENKNNFKRFQIKLINNNSGNPVGYQVNSNYMFSQAKNELVALVQSDMVIGKDFDSHMIENIEDDMVLSAARIEPPVHPPNDDKYTENFGLNPAEFQFEPFNDFCEKNKKDKITHWYGLPWVTYKKTWEKVGGFDTAFRWGKEDMDIQNRLRLSGVRAKTIWSTFIYHFTCISSRGENWNNGTDKSNLVVQCQHLADRYESVKFVRRFKSLPVPDIPNFRYYTTAVIRSNILSNWQKLRFVEPYFDKIYIENQNLVDDYLYHQKDEHAHVNWRLGFDNYGNDFWKNHYKYINVDNIKDKFVVVTPDQKIECDNVLVKFTLEDIDPQTDNCRIFENLNNIIDSQELGTYNLSEGWPNGIELKLIDKVNNIGDYLKVNNPIIDWEFEIG
jgi:GT2 family glycosyltransferase